jgi:chromosome segregation ATPase
MTNDKNNIKNLVSSGDDDPTAELEIIGRDGSAVSADVELEADANTYDYEDDDVAAETGNIEVAQLRKEIGLRDESIERMQFDIEQLRARWSGLDKEIQVREKLTDTLNAELRTTKNVLASTERDLGSKNADIERLEKLLQEQRDLLANAEARVTSGEERIKALEQQKLHADDASRQRLAHVGDVAELERHLAEKRDRIDDLTGQVTDRDRQVASLSSELDQVRRTLEDTQANLTLLKPGQGAPPPGANDNAHQLDSGASGDDVGLPIDNRQEVRELQAQLQRTEAYADTLRIRLQDKAQEADATASSLAQVEFALANAERQIAELNELLEAERLEAAGLQKQHSDLSEQFDEEVRKIRFELGIAQQTITDHETVNEQLTSDLIDNHTFRQALESKLEQTEDSADKQVRSLRQKVKRLERQHSDDLHKISNKDNAIAALLNELASRSSFIEDLDDVDDSRIQETDHGATEKPDDRMVGDRITRLLIGSVEGQELRFPLFKDRLTIGRTKQNDIQLKAQYISRRHALIVTENDRTRIVDWGSRNGVLVNRKKVTEQVLKSGDIVTIGTADFQYEERPKR